MSGLPRYAEELLGFTIDEVRAVVEALGRFAEYMTVITMIEPRGLQPRPGALADDSGVSEEVTAEILQWLGLQLGLPPVADPISAVREARERPLLYCDGDFVCPTDDVLWWAIQARLKSSFKNTKRWEKFQSHRRRLVEDDALRILKEVLNPDIGMGEAEYNSSIGAGELAPGREDGQRAAQAVERRVQRGEHAGRTRVRIGLLHTDLEGADPPNTAEPTERATQRTE